MNYLVFISGARQGARVAVDRESLCIGREPSNDIPIEEDGASRRHAEVFLREGSYFIRDLGSMNGTRLNGKKIDESILRGGDQVAIGGTVFVFQGEARRQEKQSGMRIPYFKPGDKIGKYTVLAFESGRTSSSIYQVFLVEHPITNRQLEVRWLAHRSRQQIQKCHAAARLMSQLDHPNIQMFHDIGEHDQHPFLVLEHIQGRSLPRAHHGDHELPVLVVLRMMTAISSGLQHAHDNNVIHLALSPRNIVVDDKGRPVLCGFEVSAPATDDHTEAGGRRVDAERYASPEQVADEAATTRSDIWGIGASMYYLLSGHKPFTAGSRPEWVEEVLSSDPIDISHLKNKAPEFVVDIVAKCLKKDPARRYQSADELKRALEAAIDYIETSQSDTIEMPLPKKGQTILLNVEYQEAGIPGAFRPYEIGGRIAGGTYGDVYRAIEKLSGKEVALKILKREHLADADTVVRFRREATLLSRLSHPNIVRVYNFGRYGATFFLAMDLLGERTLADVMEERGLMDAKEALSYLDPALAGLAAMHEAGIVHRDLKPDNISIADDRVVVFDFGTAHSRDLKRLTMSGMFVGTPYYASPEQAAALLATGATDVYAAGVILYEMLTGKLPHEAETAYGLLQKIVSEPPVPITERRSDLPDALLDVLDRMLAKEPEKRPSASAARELLTTATD